MILNELRSHPTILDKTGSMLLPEMTTVGGAIAPPGDWGYSARMEQRAQFALSTLDEGAQHMADLPELPAWSQPTQSVQPSTWDHWNRRQQEMTSAPVVPEEPVLNSTTPVPRLNLQQCQDQGVRPPELAMPPE